MKLQWPATGRSRPEYYQARLGSEKLSSIWFSHLWTKDYLWGKTSKVETCVGWEGRSQMEGTIYECKRSSNSKKLSCPSSLLHFPLRFLVVVSSWGYRINKPGTRCKILTSEELLGLQASLGLCYLAQLRGFMCVVVVLCPQLFNPSLSWSNPSFKKIHPTSRDRLSPSFIFLFGRLTEAAQGL